MKKVTKILLLIGCVFCIAYYNLWHLLGEDFYFLGQSIFLLIISIALIIQKINLSTSLLLYLAINQFIDEATYKGTSFSYGEYVSFAIVLIILLLRYYRRKRC